MRPNKWQIHIPSYVFQQKLIGKEVPYMGLPTQAQIKCKFLDFGESAWAGERLNPYLLAQAVRHRAQGQGLNNKEKNK